MSKPDEEYEPPCEVTGVGCEWLWEGDESDATDMYCQRCYRSRDFLLKAREDLEAESVPESVDPGHSGAPHGSH